MRTHTHLWIHIKTFKTFIQSPKYSVFLVLLGISQIHCHCQITSIRTQKPSKPVWFTVSLSFSYSLSWFQSQVCHLSKFKLLYSKVLKSFVPDPFASSPFQPHWRLVESWRRRLSPHWIKRLNLMWFWLFPDSSKCQYCWALSSGLAPPLPWGRLICRAEALCLGFHLPPALFWMTVLARINSRV